MPSTRDWPSRTIYRGVMRMSYFSMSSGDRSQVLSAYIIKSRKLATEILYHTNPIMAIPFLQRKMAVLVGILHKCGGASGRMDSGGEKEAVHGLPCTAGGIRGQSIVGRSSPRKNTATVPGPLWEPMMVPMSHRRILPFRWGKRSSSAVMSRAASSGHREWQTKQRWS